MGKVPKNSSFFKLNKQLLQELGPEAAILLAYVEEYEQQGKQCFASRPYIAKQIGISETTLHRLFQRLSKSGHITIKRDGNKRFLRTSRVFKLNRQAVQNEQAMVFKMNSQAVQNEHIQRNTIQINSYKETQDKEAAVDNSVDKVKAKYENVWDESKQAMVRRRLPS
jgi:DNA-binding MarR family transcriptional regulator